MRNFFSIPLWEVDKEEEIFKCTPQKKLSLYFSFSLYSLSNYLFSKKKAKFQQVLQVLQKNYMIYIVKEIVSFPCSYPLYRKLYEQTKNSYREIDYANLWQN